MTIHTASAFWPCAMLISAMFLAMWLSKKKSIIIDVIAGILCTFAVFCIVLGFHLF